MGRAARLVARSQARLAQAWRAQVALVIVARVIVALVIAPAKEFDLKEGRPLM
jgi:hypothetical protein